MAEMDCSDRRKHMNKKKKKKIESIDVIAFLVLTLGGFIVLFPFLNMVVISFTTQKE